QPAAAQPTAPQQAATQPGAPEQAAPAQAAPAQGKPAGTKPAAAAKPAKAAPPRDDATVSVLRGVAARIVTNMEQSLAVPTATSVRAVPAKLIADNRIVINNHLARGRGGKVSFTHLIGYALVRALAVHPEMNNSYTEVDGKPALVVPEHVNLGIAIDMQRPDGSRTLVVPSIK